MLNEPRHLLVVHIAGLTETTLALPALRALRHQLPNARIAAATSMESAELLRMANCVDEIFPITRFRGAEILNPRVIYRSAKSIGEIRRSIFDLAIEFKRGAEAGIVTYLAHPLARLTQSSRSLERIIEKMTKGPATPPSTHLAHQYLKSLEPLGVRPIESEPRLETDRSADEQFEKLLTKQGLRPGEMLMGIHPGAGLGMPRWPIERFASIGARLIHNYNARVLVFAGPHERGLAKSLAAMLPAKHSIVRQSPRMQDLVSAAARLSLFIGNHSGPAQIAAAAGSPVLVISNTTRESAADLLSPLAEHLRAPHPTLITEDEVYDAACRLLRVNRADMLRSR